MAEHEYVADVHAPTCTEQGYTIYTCSVCGGSYTGDHTAPLEHSYGEWTVVTPATCTSEGERVCNCTRCDATMRETISKLAHTYAATICPATCTEHGYTTYTCSACGDSYTGDHTTELGHDYRLSAQTEEYAEYVCTRCGDSYRQTIELPQPAASALTYKLAADYLSYIVTGVEAGADVETLVIPDKYDGLPVTAIADGAFSGNEGIVCAVLGKNIASIGDSAFENCSFLQSVNIPEQVTYIGSRAFRHCTALEGIEFNAAAAGDCYDVFYNAGAYGGGITVTFGSAVVAIPSNLFNVLDMSYAPNVVQIAFSADCRAESIGDGAFMYCTRLTSAELPASITYIGYEAFYGCSSLVYAEVSSSAEVKSGAFGGVSANFELANI